MKNVDKTATAEVAKISSTIDLDNKYSQAINNADIDVAKNLRLIDIEKYWRYVGQIQDKVNRLYKD